MTTYRGIDRFSSEPLELFILICQLYSALILGADGGLLIIRNIRVFLCVILKPDLWLLIVSFSYVSQRKSSDLIARNKHKTKEFCAWV